MNTEQLAEILKAWNILELEKNQQIIKLYEKVRDIPFGKIGSREPYTVYKSNRGTCSGKHFLLRDLYKKIGIQTEDMICLQRWKDLTWFPDDKYTTVSFPKYIKDYLNNNEVVDFHNYLKIQVDGNWFQIDATIDKPLKALGFYTTENWNGKSDMSLCFVGSQKIWNCKDGGLEKKQLLTKALPIKLENNREEFLKIMTEWLNAWRKKAI